MASDSDILDWLPRPGFCKYIMDDGPWDRDPPQWCPHRAMKGSVYCKTHHRRCYSSGAVTRAVYRKRRPHRAAADIPADGPDG